MLKLQKFVKSFGIVCLILFVLSLGLSLFINLFNGSLNLSVVTYFNFALTLFNGSLSNLNVLSIVSVAVLCFGVLFALIWLILLLIKKRFIAFLYFVLELVIALMFSYCFILYADVVVDGTTFNYFKDVTDLAKTGDVLELVLLIAYLFLSSLTFCFTFVYGILTIVYAYQSKDVEEVKTSEEKVVAPIETKPVENKEEVKKVKKEERILLVKPRVNKTIDKQVVTNEVASKKPIAEEKKPVKTEEKATPKKDETKKSSKVYHISHHPTEDKWQVKLAKGEKALKLFDTQLEAIEYAKEVSKNQGGSIRLHSVAGRIRKL